MRQARTRCLFFCLSVAGAASAAEPGIDLRGFQPPLDPQSSLVLEPVSVPRSGDFSASWLASYAYRLTRIVDEHGTQLAVPLRHQLSYDLLLNVGVGSRWALGLAAPGVLYQHGDRLSNDTWRPPATAIGDPSLEAKFVIVPKGELGGYGLSALSRVTIPLASPESGMGDGATTVQARLLGELDLILAGLRASVGVRLRSEERVFFGDQFGHAAPWALGVSFRPQALGWDKQGRWHWFLDAHGAVALTPEFATKHSSPIAIAASTRYALGGDFSMVSGLELPLNGAVGTPSLRVVLGITWAPRFIDSDEDGIADDNDDCPEGMPEDRDGFEDDDGCPEDDNDGDGVPDATDRCPKALEDTDGYRDDDGCPDPDNDGDTIADTEDACPDVPGVASKSKKHHGCPVGDEDKDGVLDDVDRCPDQAEDPDGRFDQDGCPDPDDDADGVLDGDDDCPTHRGPKRSVPGLNGCPDPDRDADTYYGNYGDTFAWTDLLGPEQGPVGRTRDNCPDEPEDFDGDKDDDGCPDPDPAKKKPTPLVTLELTGNAGSLRLAHPLTWESKASANVSATDLAVLRAIAKELRLHRELMALVGVRAARPSESELADARAKRIVALLQRLTLRDSSAAKAEFSQVSGAPNAQRTGIGILLTSTPKGTVPGTTPPASP